jgi:plastocyanin
MTEYAFTPSTIEAKVGQQVTLNLVNKGSLEHEIMFGRDVMMMNDHPSGYQHDMFEEAGVEPTVMMMENMEGMEESEHEEEAHSGFMVFLAKTGDEATLTFTVSEDMVGEWEMGCFELEGVHYTSGMVGKFIVQP